MTGPRYPWLLPAEHALHRPFLGFSRAMTSAQYRRALAQVARNFAREYSAWAIDE